MCGYLWYFSMTSPGVNHQITGCESAITHSGDPDENLGCYFPGPSFVSGIATRQAAASGAKAKTQCLRCEVCGITVTSRVVLDEHLTGA